jgi:hypothetical protein
MKGRIFIIKLVAVIAAGCGQNRKAEQFQALPFPDVKIPAMMTGSADVAEYISMHYWDGLTDPSRDYPCDSLYVSGVKKEDVEQKFADWNAVLGVLPRSIADKAVNALYEKAAACERKDTSSNVLDTFVMLAEKYFYDPNSPVRNEDHYHAFVRNLASFEGFDEAVRGKYAYQARMTALNREGTVAADFRFADRNGRIHSLHGINAPMTLLFFSNPGCDACMEIIKVLSGHEGIAAMIADGRLAVLNIYIDEDIQAWRDYMPIYPEQWYNGFDPDLVIRGETLYNVRAIPSLYLLDHEKRVILKDAPENRVFETLLSR